MTDRDHKRRIIPRLLASSRLAILFAVIGAFLASLMLLVYGALVVVELMIDLIRKGEVSTYGAKDLAVDVIQMIDLFLLGTVTYIVAIGLYELFFDDDLPVPAWLEIHSLDDLKGKLVGVVILLLGVTYLGSAVSSSEGDHLLELGLASAAVILALTLSQTLSGGKKPQAIASAVSEVRTPVTDKEPHDE
jgi:uncharacterized membrane protein YqhA